MKQINLLGHEVRSVSFDSDGIYYIGSCSGTYVKYYEAEESELSTLKDNVDKVTLPNIVSGDILYFDKSASFPKLMLGRLDLDIKRTIKEEKSTKIIVDDSILIDKSDINAEYGYIIMVGGTNETDFKQVFYISDRNVKQVLNEGGITLELMQKYFPGIWKRITVLNKKITDNIIKLINTSPEKITTIQQLAAYLNSKLPELDDGSAKTMISLFKARSEEKKLAINMLASFNVSNILYDICDAIGNATGQFDDSTKSSINYKYFKMLIGISPVEIELNWKHSSYYTKPLLAKLFNRALMSDDQKKKTWDHFKKCIIDQGYSPSSSAWNSQFNTYKMPLNYDPK